jgi:predicted Zn finger-like uncharacterized protein
MHVSCPDCATVYEVPDARLKPGRRLRCAQCMTEWPPIPAIAAPPPPEIKPEPVAAPPPPPPPPPPRELEEAPDPSPPAPAARTAPALQAPAMVERPIRLVPPEHLEAPRRRLAALPLVLAWALTLTVVSAGGWSAYQYRSRVIQVWPPSERAYAALGLGSGGK